MLPCETEAGITYEELGIIIRGNRRSGNVKTYCPKCHEDRKNRTDTSLSVEVGVGHWFCHNCQWRSGLGIEARSRGVEAQRGPIMTQNATRPHSVASTPLKSSDSTSFQQPRPAPEGMPEWATDWITRRAISPEVAARMRISAAERQIDMGGEKVTARIIYYPYYRDEQLVDVKRRILSVNGKDAKTFRREEGAEKRLYNLDAARDAGTIVVVEGEGDVHACMTVGWNSVVSSPLGAPGRILDPVTKEVKGVADVGRKGEVFETDEAHAIFSQAKRIVVATDADAEGRKLGDWLVAKYTPQRCWRVDWSEYGVKDANELLMTKGAKALEDAINHAKPVPLPGVRPLSAHKDALYRLYEQGYSPGVTSGWTEFDQYFRPETGKLVVVSGYPSHGKTTWMNHLFVNLAHINQWNIALYSPEMGEEGEVLGRLVQVATDMPFLPGADSRMSREQLDAAVEWVGQRFWEIHPENRDNGGFNILTVPQIIAQAEPLVVRNDVKVLVIDPWNRCEAAREKGQTTEEYIAKSLDTLDRWGKRNGVMVVVVIHPRKPDSINRSEDQAPHPYESAGAAHWYNMADVYMTVHRVKQGEDQGVTTVQVWKHRKEGITGNRGECRFRFDARSQRFYFEEAIIPSEIGSNPYLYLPTAEYQPAMAASWDEPF